MSLQARLRVRGRPDLPESVCPPARLLPGAGLLHRPGTRSALQVQPTLTTQAIRTWGGRTWGAGEMFMCFLSVWKDRARVCVCVI